MEYVSQPVTVTLLDGGMGRELRRMGAPFRQPEWSASALMESPELVRQAHMLFAAAGSDILTTSNYAVVPFHLGEKRFLTDGAHLTALAGRLAREAASAYGCRVAGSIPPLFGSYRPDLFIPEQAEALLEIIIRALSPYVDLWLAETVSSLAEARAVAEARCNDVRPFWISFTLSDREEGDRSTPRLRSGEEVRCAVETAVGLGASAILFNCSQPEVMAMAVATAAQGRQRLQAELQIGVYANAFPPQPQDAQANSTLAEIRQDIDPEGYLAFAETWRRLGATIIGGCCGIGPGHIALLCEKLRTR